MVKPWRCGACDRANQGYADQCYWCGGGEKMPIKPVRIPNQMQNTPSYNDLARQLEIDELRRPTTRTTEELLDELRKSAIENKNH